MPRLRILCQWRSWTASRVWLPHTLLVCNMCPAFRSFYGSPAVDGAGDCAFSGDGEDEGPAGHGCVQALARRCGTGLLESPLAALIN